MKKSSLLQGFLLSFLGALFLSTKAILVKLALHNVHTDGVTLLALRMLTSLPFYAATAFWLTRKEGNVRMNARQWTWVIVLGLLGYYLSSLFDFIGLQYISAGLERLILFLYPSFSVLINGLAFRQRITKIQYAALALTYTGIGIAYFGELRIDTGNAYFYWGSFLVFLCAITYAIYLSCMGRVVPSLGASKFTSYSMLAASPASLSAHKDDYIKIIKVWDKVVHYIDDPKTQADAVKIMSKRVGLTPAEYLPLLKGTKLLDVAAGKKTFKKGEALDSLYGSTKNADDFNVANAVYKQAQDVNSYIDPSLTAAVK